MLKIQDFWTPIFKLLIGYVQLIEFTVVLLWTIFVLSQDNLVKNGNLKLFNKFRYDVSKLREYLLLGIIVK